MGQRIKHPVLGTVEVAQPVDSYNIPTAAIEIAESFVMVSVIFFVFFQFRYFFPEEKKHLRPEDTNPAWNFAPLAFLGKIFNAIIIRPTKALISIIF